MLNTKSGEETKEALADEADSDDDVEPVNEFRFAPGVRSALAEMSTAVCERQASHPDLRMKKTPDHGGEEHDKDAYAHRQGTAPQFISMKKDCPIQQQRASHTGEMRENEQRV